MEFQIGQRVRVIKDAALSLPFIGREATIVDLDSEGISLGGDRGIIGCEFEAPFPDGRGHSCNGKGKDGLCWDIVKNNLELVEEEVHHKVSLTSVVISPDKLEEIRSAIAQEELSGIIFEQWGFGKVFEKGTAVSLLFHGIPGTGKTLTAQAIADELGMELKVITTAELESSVPGEFERRVQKFFKEASESIKKAKKDKKVKQQILLFDECDSLLSSRDRVGVIMGAQINSLLTAIERFEGIVIFTTNRIGELDPALERRISAKIEFPFPKKQEREQIWKRLIPEEAPIAKDVDFKALAEFPMAGGNIKNCVLNAARRAAYLKKTSIDRECFINAIEREMQSSSEFSAAIEQSNRRKSIVKLPVVDRAENGKNEIVRKKRS